MSIATAAGVSPIVPIVAIIVLRQLAVQTARRGRCDPPRPTLFAFLKLKQVYLQKLGDLPPSEFAVRAGCPGRCDGFPRPLTARAERSLPRGLSNPLPTRTESRCRASAQWPGAHSGTGDVQVEAQATWFNPSIAHQYYRSSEHVFDSSVQVVKTIPRQSG